MSLHKLTLIIPTKNRPDFIKRTLSYYARAGVDWRFIVGDGSIGERAEQTKHLCRIYNAEYHNLPDISIGETIKTLNQLVDTPYCALLADDDLIIPSGAKQAIEFLDNNEGYESANGKAAGFELDRSGAFGKIMDLGDYNQRGIEGETPIARFMEFYNYFVVLFAIYRTRTWKLMWEHTGVSKEIGINDEIIPCCLSAVLGKTKHLDSPYLLRQYHNRRVFGLSGDDLTASKDFKPSRLTFIYTLSKYVPVELAENYIDFATDPSRRKKPKKFSIKFPFLSKFKIMYLNTKREMTLPKLRQYEEFRLFERVMDV